MEENDIIYIIPTALDKPIKVVFENKKIIEEIRMTEIIILDDEDIKNLKNDIPISLILNDGTKIKIVSDL